MKIIDLSISNAFRRMKAAFRTNAEVSRRTNLSEVHISRILSGKTQYLSDETWERVEPILSRYMRKDDAPAAMMSDPLFRIILDNWSRLTPEDQGRLAGIVRGMVDNAPIIQKTTAEVAPVEAAPVENIPAEAAPASAPAPASVEVRPVKAKPETPAAENKKKSGPEIRCPHCHEWLYGSYVPGEKFSCPECGQHIVIHHIAKQEK